MVSLIPGAHRRPKVHLNGDRSDNAFNAFEESDTKARLKNVPVNTIVSGQHTVSHAVVAGKMSGKLKSHDPEYPYVIHHKKTHYLLDGTHRINQDLFEGNTHRKCLVIDAPDDCEWIPYSKSSPQDH